MLALSRFADELKCCSASRQTVTQQLEDLPHPQKEINNHGKKEVIEK
jgi:hypothetical protein